MCVRVHAHVAEVAAETRLHRGARARVERLARAAEARAHGFRGDTAGCRLAVRHALDAGLAFLLLPDVVGGRRLGQRFELEFLVEQRERLWLEAERGLRQARSAIEAE